MRRVINEQHDMGQLQRRVLPDPDTGRNPLQHRPLRGANQCFGAGSKIVLLQVNTPHNTVPDMSIGLRSLHIYKRIRHRTESVFRKIRFHTGIHSLNALLHIGPVQVDLRQHQPQRRGCLSHLLLHFLPISRLRSKLVTGDYRPFPHIPDIRQQNIRRIKAGFLKALVHSVSLFFQSCCPMPTARINIPSLGNIATDQSKQEVSDMMDKIALILVIVGALNWGGIGIFGFDTVAFLFGGQTAVLSRIIYALVGLAGLWCITLLFRDTEHGTGQAHTA